jgi:hypothetical protein
MSLLLPVNVVNYDLGSSIDLYHRKTCVSGEFGDRMPSSTDMNAVQLI